MASSSNPRQWIYDAFVSFRGKDIRKKFLDHLFRDFNEKGINAFRDNSDLKGVISTQLTKAIEDSRILIVIFSENYASSKWCLKELVEILKCHEIRGKPDRELLIIFFDVEPTVVRNIQGSYAEAFVKHEISYPDEVQGWKVALRMACGIGGLELKEMTNGYESRFVDIISNKILQLLCAGPLDEDENLVGLDTLLATYNVPQFIKLDEVSMIGIWGVSKIGKTTFAKAIFNSMYSLFEEHIFIENINQSHLTVTQIIAKIVNIEEHNLPSADEGRKIMKRRLLARPVLLVLDDIDMASLEAFAGSPDWFCQGSVIIVTGNDLQLLKSHSGMRTIIIMEPLFPDHALELFSLHAFHARQPKEEFRELSYQLMNYARGHPLALKLLGGFLYGTRVSEWKSKMAKLQEEPHEDIDKALRLSLLEGLSNSQKNMFLDIASSFIGENIVFAKHVIESYNNSYETDIKVLSDRALIDFRSFASFEMHVLIQAMAWGMVQDKEYQSRYLWITKDVREALRYNEVTKAVEIVILLLENTSTSIPKVACACFKQMYKLRILKICDVVETYKVKSPHEFQVEYTGRLERLSDELRWLIWHGFPFEFLPSEFYPENIVSIDLSYSNIVEFWITTSMRFQKLRQIRLRHCLKLRSTPDFTKMTNIQELIFKGCVNLIRIHSSIGLLKMLVILNLNNCNLSELSPEIGDLSSLEELHLSGNNFVYLPETLSQLSKLTWLSVRGCKNLVKLPQLPQGLQRFYGRDCTSLEELEKLPTIHQDYPQSLNLSGCPKLLNKKLIHTLLPQGKDYLTMWLEVVLYKNKIPQRFTFRGIGDCVIVNLPEDWQHQNLEGYEVCVVFTRGTGKFDRDQGWPLKYSVKNSDGVDLKVGFHMLSDMDNMEDMIGSDATWLQSTCRWKGWVNAKDDFVTFEFTGSSCCEVKECGVRLIYGENMQQETILNNLLELPALQQHGGMFALIQDGEVRAVPGGNRSMWWSSN